MDKILTYLFIAAMSALFTTIIFKRVFKRDCKKLLKEYLNETSMIYNDTLYIHPMFDNLDRVFTEKQMREHTKMYVEECIQTCIDKVDKI